jgi:hypothetical protein
MDSSSYSLSDYENDNAKFFSKNQEEPFLYKFTDVLYPNPEFLSDSIPDDISSYRVNLCIFYVDHSCVLPFIKYAVLVDGSNADGTVGFVEFEKENTASENLESQVTQQLQSLFDSGDNGSVDLFSNSYKGFIVRQDYIYMFFDITSLLTAKHQLNPSFIYAVADELCNLKSVFNYSLSQGVQNLFDSDDDTFPKCAILQPWFYNLDGMLELIEIPHIGYICDTDKFHSLTQDELREIFVPVDCLMEHDDHGFLYYFSENLVKPIEDATYIRFVIFAMKTGYSLSEECNSITFKSHKTRIWGIKSIDQFIPI